MLKLINSPSEGLELSGDMVYADMTSCKLIKDCACILPSSSCMKTLNVSVPSVSLESIRVGILK